jgi:hypothetical protein
VTGGVSSAGGARGGNTSAGNGPSAGAAGDSTPPGEGGAAGAGEVEGGAPSAGGGGAGGTGSPTGGANASTTGGATGKGGGDACPEPPPGPGEGGLYDGSISIAGPDDAEMANEYSEITGDLVIQSSYEGVLDLPNLVRLGGTLRAESPLIMNNTAIDWGRMTELRVPNLESIGGQLYLYLLQELVETDFRNLHTVADDVYIYRILGLRRVRLDSLTECGGLYFADDQLLAQCEIDAICERVAGTCQGADPDCTCATECGLLTPHC